MQIKRARRPIANISPLRSAFGTDPGNRQLPSHRQNDRSDEEANNAVDEDSPDHPDQDDERGCGQASPMTSGFRMLSAQIRSRETPSAEARSGIPCQSRSR